MTGLAVGLMAASAAYGAYSSYQQGQEAAANIRAQSRIQANEIQRQAEANAEAQRAQARSFERQASSAMMDADKQVFQAKEELRQGEVAQERANIEQIKGEREAAKRSRMLAQEIGQQYANFAANGIAVDASPTDTVGSVLRSTVTEGQADISTILENANLNKWTYEEQKRTFQRSAANSLAGANNSVFRSDSLMASGQDARKAAATTLSNAAQAAQETLIYGERAAKSAKKAGVRGAWGSVLQGAADMAMFGAK